MLENHFNNFKEEIIFDPNEHGKNKKHPSGCFLYHSLIFQNRLNNLL